MDLDDEELDDWLPLEVGRRLLRRGARSTRSPVHAWGCMLVRAASTLEQAPDIRWTAGLEVLHQFWELHGFLPLEMGLRSVLPRH